jgi:predicted AlkP superfamily pyrophosphatase or phosphodiesterase
MESRTTVIIVSDHGFKVVKNQIDVRPAVAAAGLTDEVYVLPEGGFELLYVKPEKRADTVAKLRKALSEIEGIAEVAGPERFEALGLPTADPQMADLFLVPKPGFAFANSRGGAVSTPVPSATGAHGYLNSDPELDAIFIASGAGIRGGGVVERVRNLDVAPTIAELLGIRMEAGIEGKALREVLK